MTDRNEYIEKMKAQMDEWNADIGKLEAKLENANDETKDKFAHHLTKVQEARDAVVKKFGKLENAGEDSWDSASAEVDHVWNSLKHAVHDFKSHI